MESTDGRLKPTAEEVIRARNEATAEAQRVKDAEWEVEHRRCREANMLKLFRLRQDVIREAEAAIRRLAREQWRGGQFEEVIFWDGTFVKVRREGVIFFRRSTVEASIVKRETGAWLLNDGSKSPGYLLSNGHLAFRGVIDLYDGTVYPLRTRMVDGPYVEGLIDSESGMNEALDRHDVDGLVKLLACLKSLPERRKTRWFSA